mgnify:FL=1
MVEKKFKETEVGMIPEDWEVVSLGSIGEPKMCKRIMKHQTLTMGDVPFYKIGTFGGKADAFISRELFEHYKSLYSYPNVGDVLISAAGTIGRLVIYKGDDEYFQDSNIVWIDNNENKVLNKFLYYALRDTNWDTSQGTIPRLYNNSLRAKTIKIPRALPEQQRIAEALSDVDALVTTLGKLIEKKKNIKLATMQQLLTGKHRLKGFGLDERTGSRPTDERRKECHSERSTKCEVEESSGYKMTEIGIIPEDWDCVPFHVRCYFCNESIDVSSFKAENYVGTDNMLSDKLGVTPFVGQLPYQRVKQYRKGDILISNIRPYLKKCWLADKDGGCSADVLVVRGDKNLYDERYLFFALCNDKFFYGGF